MSEKELIENLVIASLSVNNYPIEKTYKLRDGLDKQEIFEINILRNTKHEEIYNRLVKSGYDRGEYINGNLTAGLVDIGKILDRSNLILLSKAVEKKDIDAIEKLLLPIRGVGKYVISNFCILCNIK